MRKVLTLKHSLSTFLKKSYGIGSSTVVSVSKFLGLNDRLYLKKLRVRHVSGIKKKIRFISFGLDLKESVKDTVRFLIRIKSYRGIRHKNKYPSRGQRTHTNAKTKKKVSILKSDLLILTFYYSSC